MKQEVESRILGKNGKPFGAAPSLVLCDPRYPHNVGAAVRAASCFGLGQVWFTGDRVRLELEASKRLPREERMKGWRDVQLINYASARPLEQFSREVTPVAIEMRPNSEFLPDFVHPENPVYVFGPEDGSIPQSMLAACHRFVVIPTRFCVNLAAAVYIVLYDRMVKRGERPLLDHAEKVLDPKIEFESVLWGQQ